MPCARPTPGPSQLEFSSPVKHGKQNYPRNWSRNNCILSSPSTPTPSSPQHAQAQKPSTPLFLPDTVEKCVKYEEGFDPESVPGADVVLCSLNNSSGLHFAMRRRELEVFCPEILSGSEDAGSRVVTAESQLPVILVDFKTFVMEGFACFVSGLPLPDEYTENFHACRDLLEVLLRYNTWRNALTPLISTFEQFTSTSTKDLATGGRFALRQHWQHGANLVLYSAAALHKHTTDKIARKNPHFRRDGPFGDAMYRLVRRIRRGVFDHHGDTVVIPALDAYDFIWFNVGKKDRKKEIFVGVGRQSYFVAEWFADFCKAMVTKVLDRPCWESANSADCAYFFGPFQLQASKVYSPKQLDLANNHIHTFVRIIADAVEVQVKKVSLSAIISRYLVLTVLADTDEGPVTGSHTLRFCGSIESSWDATTTRAEA
ncbi:hypothetical protein PsYK624_155350 [Phanerochaete sordida]|uniref:Uncharacterized protein n=1 Tax=Phanerochaete sordida TaxID=48140 RepID=A0A9P3LME7_9APHY|nr:hypothetical protein PsYK624_155350 [Phanerochaete sordida]